MRHYDYSEELSLERPPGRFVVLGEPMFTALPAGLYLRSVMDGTLMSFDNIHYRNNLAVNFPYKAPLKPPIGAHPLCRGSHSLSLNACQE